MSTETGFTWAEQVPYLCVCGVQYPATRLRWVDRDADPETAATVLIDGPLSGACPSCGEDALGRVPWLEVTPSEQRAVLVMPATSRAEIIEVLQSHLAQVARRAIASPSWILRPSWRFEAVGERPEKPQVADAGVPKLVGRSAGSMGGGETGASSVYVAALERHEGRVTVEVLLDEAGRRLWGRAALQGRPIHLRGLGYPLIGVRLVASYLGRTSLIDAVVDVGTEAANTLFADLSEEFRVQLILRSRTGSSPVSREIVTDALARNAAMCLESARAVLASGEFPPGAYSEAVGALRATPMAERLAPSATPLSPGAYRHLITAGETWNALDTLDQVSRKENLSRLLELDGLPIREFEAIRKRVLAASIEHGICAPRRFWRRVVASGLAQSPDDYASRLGVARAAEVEHDDLSDEQRQEAWVRLQEYCERRDLPFPAALTRALGIEAVEQTGPGISAVAGEIVTPDSKDRGERLAEQLRDPQVRLTAAISALGEGGAVRGLDVVLEALERFDMAELLAILPPLAELGTTAVPGLLRQLDSPRREVRHAVTILLGFAPDEASVEPLCRKLLSEKTKVWVDVARAIGSHGPRALGQLCKELQHPSDDPKNQLSRIARAMAEVALADADEGVSPGQDAVEALVEVPDDRVARAASRALATLHDVALAGAQVRGERAMREVTVVRGFARMAYEAITIPELDAVEEMEA